MPQTFAAQRDAGIAAAGENRIDDAMFHFLRAANQNHVESVGGKNDAAIDTALLALGRRHAVPVRPRGRSGPRLKVAHVNPYWLDHGGHSSVVLGALAYHDADRYDVHGYSLELHDSRQYGPRALAQAESLGIRYHSLQAATYADKADELWARLHDDGIDVAVFYPAPNDGISPYVAARRPACTTVMFDTNNIGFNLGPFLFDHHVDTSPAVLTECRTSAAGQPVEFHFFERFPQFFSTRSVDAVPLPRAELGLPSDATVSITVGQLFKLQHRGSSMYFDMLDRLLAGVPQHHHVIVCAVTDDAFAAMLRDRYRGRVHHMPPRFDLGRVYQACDVYINSFPVGGGCSLQEAIAVGLPTVSLSDRRTPDMQIISEEIGDRRLVVDTPEELVDVVVRLLDDPVFRQGAGRANRERFDTTLHARRVMARFEDLLQSIQASV